MIYFIIKKALLLIMLILSTSINTALGEEDPVGDEIRAQDPGFGLKELTIENGGINTAIHGNGITKVVIVDQDPTSPDTYYVTCAREQANPFTTNCLSRTKGILKGEVYSQRIPFLGAPDGTIMIMDLLRSDGTANFSQFDGTISDVPGDFRDSGPNRVPDGCRFFNRSSASIFATDDRANVGSPYCRWEAGKIYYFNIRAAEAATTANPPRCTTEPVSGKLDNCSFFTSDRVQSFKWNPKAFVEFLYEKLLGRQADAEGTRYWVGAITTRDEMTPAELIDTFLSTEEFGNTKEAIALRLFGSAVGAPTQAQLNKLDRLIRGNNSAMDMAEEFYCWEEFAQSMNSGTLQMPGCVPNDNTIQSLNNINYIEKLYDAFLGRNPGPNENYWDNQLLAGMEPYRILLEFAVSGENKSNVIANPKEFPTYKEYPVYRALINSLPPSSKPRSVSNGEELSEVELIEYLLSIDSYVGPKAPTDPPQVL